MSDGGGLAAVIDDIAAEAGGRIGAVVRHVPSGEGVARGTEEVFPSASVIKVPILAALFAEVAGGRCDWEERLTVREEAFVEGSGVLREMHVGLEVTLRDLARLMIVVSDNTASNLLMDRIRIERVNVWLATFGCERTRLGRKFYDFAARDAGHENLCTAGEMADLLVRMARGTLVSPAASGEMLAILRRQAYTDRIPALLPPGTEVAHKTGTITGVCHDVGVIFGASGPIALAVLTQGCHDPVAAETAIRRIARAAYDAFNASADK